MNVHIKHAPVQMIYIYVVVRPHRWLPRPTSLTTSEFLALLNAIKKDDFFIVSTGCKLDGKLGKSNFKIT
jgi:hypothetical protein